MKKTYMNPSMKVREMKHRSTLLAGSLKSLGTTEATSGNLSRDADYYYDDEEDW